MNLLSREVLCCEACEEGGGEGISCAGRDLKMEGRGGEKRNKICEER